MEIREMTIEDIEKRMSEIKELKDSPEANVEELTEEVRQLSERKEELRKAAEQRTADLEAIVTGAQDATTVKTFEEERKMDVKEIRNSQEYINAYANYIKTSDDTECRKLLSENGGGKVAVPELVSDIIKNAWEKEGIMKRVKKSYIKGNLKLGFEISADPAVVHTEGSDKPAEETLVLGIVELVPESIKKWITISDEALDLAGDAFLRYVYEEVAYQIAKKAATEIIGDIEACGTVSTNSGSNNVCAVPVVAENTIALGTIAKALAALSDQASNPVIVMNKATWANFKAVQYAGDFAVDPFEGLEVEFNNAVTAYDSADTGDTYAIVGDFGYGAQANFPNGEDITFKFDDKSLAEYDLVKVVGREYIGHDVVAPKAFVKIQK